RHHDRRPRDDGTGAPRRDRRARRAHHRVRHARDLHRGRGRRRAVLTMELRELVASHLHAASCGWSVGAYGAIAEFHREASEPAEVDGLSVVTARGAIAIDPPPGCRAFDGERIIVLAAPGAHMTARAGIACLGPDGDALRVQDRGALLFDLGLGLE